MIRRDAHTLLTRRLVSALLGLLPLFAFPDIVAQQSKKALVFRNVDVFDGSRVIRNTTVIVSDGMIRAVGPDLALPEQAEIVDGKGKTLLPGLIDAHVHLGLVQGERFLRDAMLFGVTTELEMWGSEASRELRDKITRAGINEIADLRTAGPGITVPHGHPTQMGGPTFPTLGPNDDIQAFVDARIAEGGDYIKIIYEHRLPTLTRRQLEDVIVAAHRRNRLVVVHTTNQRDAREAVAAGADGLAHIFADSSPERDFAKFVAAHKAFVIPTLSVFEALTKTTASHWWDQQPGLTQYITPSMKGSLEMRFPEGLGGKMQFANAVAAVAELRRAGVSILAGTDAPAPGMAHGISLHRELQLLVQAGLTPVEALAAATSETARGFGFHDRGRIAVGTRADLVLVNGDPSVDIKKTQDIHGVWKLGVRFSRRSE